MFSKYKRGSKVVVYGPGKKDNKFYNNVIAIIIDVDPYYLDYHVKFEDGTEDWILPKYLTNLLTPKDEGE